MILGRPGQIRSSFRILCFGVRFSDLFGYCLRAWRRSQPFAAKSTYFNMNNAAMSFKKLRGPETPRDWSLDMGQSSWRFILKARACFRA